MAFTLWAEGRIEENLAKASIDPGFTPFSILRFWEV
jgi:hypothetical protein